MKILQNVAGAACLKIEGVDGKEISIAFDDSCQGNLRTTMIRSTLCVFQKVHFNQKNITHEIFEGQEEVNYPSMEDLIKAWEAIKKETPTMVEVSSFTFYEIEEEVIEYNRHIHSVGPLWMSSDVFVKSYKTQKDSEEVMRRERGNGAVTYFADQRLIDILNQLNKNEN